MTPNDRIQARTNLLIIDYNTLRYDSFDIFRTYLLDREKAMTLLPEHRRFFTMSYGDQIRYFFDHQDKRDFADWFKGFEPDSFPESIYTPMEHKLAFSLKMETPTALSDLIDVSLRNATITSVYILSHPNASKIIEVPGKSKQFTTRGLFNAELIADFIERNRINAVILDSVDMTIELSKRTNDTTFMFGKYCYNLEKTGSVALFKRMDELNRLEYERHHEYGSFSPFHFANPKKEDK